MRGALQLHAVDLASSLCWNLAMGVGLIYFLCGKSYLNALFLSCNGPCLSCSHVGGASFPTHPHDVAPK